MPGIDPPAAGKQPAEVRAVPPPPNTSSEADRRFALLFANHPLPMWIFDPDTYRFLDVNDAAVRTYGYTREEFLRMTIKDIRPSEDVPKLVETVAKYTNASEVVGLWRHRKKDGTVIEVEVMTCNFVIDGKRLPLVLAHDITEQVRLGGYRTLDYAVTRALTEAGSLEEAAPRILRAVCEVIGFDIGELWRLDEERGVMRWAGTWHRPTEFADRFEDASREALTARGEGLAGRAWATGRPVVVTDILREENVLRQDLAELSGLHGALAFPLSSRGRIVGAMVFLMRNMVALDEPLLELFADLGHRVGQALETEKAVRARQRFEERFRVGFRATPIPFVISRVADSVMVEANDAFLDFFGYRREEVVGKSALVLGMWWDPADRERVVREVEAHGSARGIDARFRTRSGEPREALVFSDVVRDEGDATMLTILVDLTERKEMQRRLVDSERLATMGETAAFLAHEINTPLTNVALLTATAARQNQDPAVAEKLQRIDAQRRLATSIISNLFTLAGSRHVAPTDIDLRGPIQAAVAEAEGIRKTGVELRVELGSSPVMVRVDPLRIQQAVFNLLKNGLEATDRGFLEVRLDDHHDSVEITVRDTGRGVAADNLANLFRPFYTTKGAGQGTGLGLAFCRTVVEAHGGTVSAQSTLGEGTTFTIRLPRGPVQGPATPAQGGPSRGT